MKPVWLLSRPSWTAPSWPMRFLWSIFSTAPGAVSSPSVCTSVVGWTTCDPAARARLDPAPVPSGSFAQVEGHAAADEADRARRVDGQLVRLLLGDRARLRHDLVEPGLALEVADQVVLGLRPVERDRQPARGVVVGQAAPDPSGREPDRRGEGNAVREV